jgi:hypothetical protein
MEEQENCPNAVFIGVGTAWNAHQVELFFFFFDGNQVELLQT